MKERPILFNGEMVRAVLEGRKTQTRRILKPKQIPVLLEEPFDITSDEKARYMSEVQGGRYGFAAFGETEKKCLEHLVQCGGCPYGGIRNELWVKESHYLYGYWVTNGETKTGKQKNSFAYQKEMGVRFPDNPPENIFTRKEGQRGRGWFKRNSLFMPRWASRTQLKITNVRVERVQDISDKDAKSEGASCVVWYQPEGKPEGESQNLSEQAHDLVHPSHGKKYGISYRNGFATLWDSINNKSGYGWEINPWVWVVDFEGLK